MKTEIDEKKGKRKSLAKFLCNITLKEAGRKYNWKELDIEKKKSWAKLVRAILKNKEKIIKKIKDCEGLI